MTLDNLSIRLLGKDEAEDTTLINALVNIVNEVYNETEEGIFPPDYRRTNAQEVADYIRNGQLAAAFIQNQPVGCVSMKQISPTLGQFGMLALEAAHRGGGHGRRMARFAEDHCRDVLGCSVMQVELLVPTTFTHAFKERNQAWYLRMGYKVVKLGSFEEDWPHLAPLLVGPTDYRVFEKPLV